MRYERERDVRIPELVEKIHNFLGEACCVSIKVISTLLGVGATTVQRIIHENLNRCKMCAKFVPMVLTGEHPRREGARQSLSLLSCWLPNAQQRRASTSL